MKNINNQPQNTESMGNFLDGFKSILMTAVKEAMKEVIEDKMYENVAVDQKLTSKQLCERWNISQNTLCTREARGIITPIRLGGKKKLYSLKDVRDAETEYNNFGRAC